MDTHIPAEKRDEAAAKISEFVEKANEELLKIPAECSVTRAFAVYLTSSFSVERGNEIHDMGLAMELMQGLFDLEKRMVALETREQG